MRKSNFELLRIIAILGIVIAHLVGYASGAAELMNGATRQSLYLSSLSALGKIGVHLFFLISGYFLWNKDFNPKRLKNLILNTIFYSTILGFAVMIFEKSLSARSILVSLLPILSNSYWFICAYIIIMLVSPILNKIIHYLEHNKRWYIFYIIVIAFYAVNTIGKFNSISFDISNEYRLFTYALTYILGAKMAVMRTNKTPAKNIIFLIISILILVLTRYVKVYILRQTGMQLWVADDRDFSILLVALSLFNVTKSINIGSIKPINKISESVFSVYLITENIFIRPYLWKTFDLTRYNNSAMLYIYPIVASILVVICCMLIDQLVKKIIPFITNEITRRK